jgi:N-ethylmaleimide reductase
VSSSATTMSGLARTYEGKQPHVEAKALSHEEIEGILNDYRAAAQNALRAGFDGVQIHAANGYLIDQFLRDNANFRTDEYGGSIENRIRLLRRVTAAVAETVGADRTAVRLSPNEERQGVNDSNPAPLFEAAAAALSELKIAFLEVREPNYDGTNGKAERPPIAPAMRKAFAGMFVLNSDYDAARSQAALDANEADAIAFGRAFIANPDLPYRLAEGVPLSKDDIATWYEGGANGYADYPAAAG